jgi:N-acetylglucosaminyldiphosphoundecaprenol N-acetyl-beta-D-mannosaminyltransferase
MSHDSRAERTNILGVGVTATNLSDATRQIGQWIDEGRKEYVVLCTVHTILEAMDHPSLRQRINAAGMATPDGMPLVFLSRLRGHREVNRVYGPDLLLEVAAVAAERGYRFYFYGGAEGVADEILDVMTARFPGLQVVGATSPPMRDQEAEEDEAVIQQINAAEPDIIWVGLGSPKQDRWMARHRDRLDAPVLIGIGAAFDFLSHRTPQAPRWIQRSGFEWLFRLITEPRRLWRRYVIGNPRFVYHILLQRLGLRTYPLD